MPNITFVLPHWLYWSGLILFPLMIMFLLRGSRTEQQQSQTASIPIAWFLLVTAGFIGMHRLYLRNNWGLLFVPLFIALLVMNATARDTRDAISMARNEIAKAEFLIEVAEKKHKAGKKDAAEQLDKRKAELEAAKDLMVDAQGEQIFWIRMVQAAALLILLGLIWDAVNLKKLKRRCDELDASDPIHQFDFSCATVTADGGVTVREDRVFSRYVGRLNKFCGSFVAYWSVIAVIVYYFEVLARYVFNSPTNWAHESMFLMFGAQYLIAGGFCLRENAHVRVDVFYTNFSQHKKALIDVLTSVFFFIFVITLMITGLTFFKDSFAVREVSFTEWAIQYYPIKFTLFLGAALLLLQGLSNLLKDINTLLGARRLGN